jgi:hypothetical protein
MTCQPNILHPENAGRMIWTKSAPENANFSIRDNFNPDSKVTELSDLHSEKHESPNTSTNAGRMISIKSVRLNDLIQFVTISILIQI